MTLLSFHPQLHLSAELTALRLSLRERAHQQFIQSSAQETLSTMSFNWQSVRPLVVAIGGASDDGATFAIARDNPHLDFLVQDTDDSPSPLERPLNVRVSNASEPLDRQAERPQVFFVANQRILHTFTEAHLSLMLVRLHSAALQSNATLVIYHHETGIEGQDPRSFDELRRIVTAAEWHIRDEQLHPVSEKHHPAHRRPLLRVIIAIPLNVPCEPGQLPILQVIEPLLQADIKFREEEGREVVG
ncbi:hypothetical protein PsYK624_003860 [Phanerochaete sordida]|uniref:Uncharacterized protein n=1 Tax=Phanerochaete sordida TaxID=48140 RepID=A0A9P3L6X3_9APHY|nr:hypothetical protein PsYK624_003860 [Phanerochaete sordida]